ncbi:hypothetical protein [Lacticaseibacillus daqingensis]|uniref:hypothetical protein n=1 Tax=Lacticaseibacillus daqingensis TaxID=2486014 RepID=UPI000F7AF574|nr:hypothetical protein [Lacticaseibacillus daqingensis]
MGIKISIDKYQIIQTSPYQYTVGQPYTDKTGTVVVQQAHYFPKMSMALDYVRQKLVLAEDIKTLDDFNAANNKALEAMIFWVGTTPLKDMEVPR